MINNQDKQKVLDNLDETLIEGIYEEFIESLGFDNSYVSFSGNAYTTYLLEGDVIFITYLSSATVVEQIHLFKMYKKLKNRHKARIYYISKDNRWENHSRRVDDIYELLI